MNPIIYITESELFCMTVGALSVMQMLPNLLY
jgi:hypothetical protein